MPSVPSPTFSAPLPELPFFVVPAPDAPSALRHSESQKNPTFPPSSSQAEISLAFFLSVIQRPLRAAKTSTAKMPLISVAVVMTGIP